MAGSHPVIMSLLMVVTRAAPDEHLGQGRAADLLGHLGISPRFEGIDDDLPGDQADRCIPIQG